MVIMKNKIVILVLLCCSFASFAKTIKQDLDEIRNIDILDANRISYFANKNENVYNVMSYDRHNLSSLSDDCRNNKIVEMFLLKLLDVNEYVRFRMIDYNSEYETMKFLNENFKKNFVDSVRSTPSLMRYYSDSLYKVAIEKEQESFYSDSFVYSNYVIKIFSDMKFPEAHNLLSENLKNKRQCLWMRKILRHLQDPIEWDEFINTLKNAIINKELSSTQLAFYRSYCSTLEYGSMSVSFFLSMLDCDSATDLVVNCVDRHEIKKYPFVISMLCSPGVISKFLFDSNDAFIKSIYNELLGNVESFPYCDLYETKLMSLTYDDLLEISRRIRNNKDKFEYVLVPLKEKLDKENDWWLSRMPYKNK